MYKILFSHSILNTCFRVQIETISYITVYFYNDNSSAVADRNTGSSIWEINSLDSPRLFPSRIHKIEANKNGIADFRSILFSILGNWRNQSGAWLFFINGARILMWPPVMSVVLC